MSYEIPPPLQHKEKIIFGLTFEQLLYAGVALLLDALILKVIPNATIKFTIIIFVTVTAVLFMFFNAKEHIKNFYHFTKFTKADIYSETISNYIGIKTIENNAIITKNNKKIALLEVQPINFNIKTETEQESNILGFQKLLKKKIFIIF